MKLTIPVLALLLGASACKKQSSETDIQKVSAASGSFRPSDFFAEGVTYTRPAGTRGFGGGAVSIIRKDEILYIKVPILFLGAGTFSRTNLEKVKSISLPEIVPPKEIFQPGLDSFSDNKMIADAILKMTQSIETAFESEHVRIKIMPEFGKDSDYLSASQKKTTDYSSYLMSLRQGVEKLHARKKTPFIPILIAGQPEATRASPSEWDLYSQPRLYAHELFHVMGTLFEGYECEKYPPYGLMQDDYMFHAMDQAAPTIKHPFLQTSDLIQMLSNGYGEVADIRPAIKNGDKFNAVIQQYSSGAICDRDTNMERLEYTAWPHEKKLKAAQTTVSEFLSGKRTYSEFLK